MKRQFLAQWADAKRRLGDAILAAGCTSQVLSQMNDATEGLEVIAIYREGQPLTIIAARYMFSRADRAPSVFLFIQESSVAVTLGMKTQGTWADTTAMLKRIAEREG